MPKINQLTPATSLANTDLIITDTNTGSNTRNIQYSNLRTQIQNESTSVFALKGEYATDEQVATAVTNWLDENVDPAGSAVVVDSTLTISGAAADAKIAGDGITNLKNAVTDITGNTQIEMTAGKYIDLSLSSVTMSGGVPQFSGNSANYSVGYMACTGGDEFCVSGTGGSQTRLWGFVNASGTILQVSVASATENSAVHIAPADSAFIIVHTSNNNQRRSYKNDIVANFKRQIKLYNSFNLLYPFHINSRTQNGITFTNDVGDGITVSGIATGTALLNIFYGSRTFPGNLSVGDTFTLYFDGESKVYCEGYLYVDGTLTETQLFSISSTYSEGYNVTIPSNASGILIRLKVTSGVNLSTPITVTPRVLTAMSNSMLEERAQISHPRVLSSTSFNNLFGKNGFWFLSDSQTYTDKPSGFGVSGFIQVLSSKNACLQLLYNWTGGTIHKRRALRSVSTGVITWEDWQIISGGNSITNNYTLNEYSQTVTLNASPSITTDTNNYLASTGTTTDRTADILAMLQSTGICRLGPGLFVVNGLQMPTGSSLIGSGYSTEVRMSGTSDGFAIKMNSDCLVQNLLLNGSDSWISGFTSTEGGRHGILWQGTYHTDQNAPGRGIIDNVRVQRFTGGGIRCYDTGTPTTTMLEVTNVFVRGCWAGIDIAYSSEYHKFTNARCVACYVGCVNNGGNNVFTNCDFSSNLEIGMLMDNSQGQSPNNTHGSCVGCVFNHTSSGGTSNNGIGIKILGGSSGFAFVGCQIFFSRTYIEDSIGISFTGCNYGNVNCGISVVGGSNTSGMAMLLTNSTCSGSSNIPITVTNNANVHVANCYNRTTGQVWSN